TGLFMFLLLRALALHPPAALTGALVWMFCGLQVVWTEFQTPTAALCWLPGILWAWERYVQGGGWRWAVFGSGTGIALALLAGHLHFCFYVLMAFVLYAVWRAVPDGRRKTDDGIDRQSQGTVVTQFRPPPSVVRQMSALLFTLIFGITLSMA